MTVNSISAVNSINSQVSFSGRNRYDKVKNVPVKTKEEEIREARKKVEDTAAKSAKNVHPLTVGIASVAGLASLIGSKKFAVPAVRKLLVTGGEALVTVAAKVCSSIASLFNKKVNTEGFVGEVEKVANNLRGTEEVDTGMLDTFEKYISKATSPEKAQTVRNYMEKHDLTNYPKVIDFLAGAGIAVTAADITSDKAEQGLDEMDIKSALKEFVKTAGLDEAGIDLDELFDDAA